MLNYQQISPPDSLPVSVEQAMAHMRVVDTADEATIDLYLRAALAHAEMYCGRAFSESEWEVRLNCFPTGEITLWPRPVASVDRITYADENSVSTIMPSADYTLATLGRLTPVTAWPATTAVNDAVSIIYTVEGEAPADIKHAVLLIAAHWFNQRETAAPGVMNEVPFGAESLLRLHCAMFV